MRRLSSAGAAPAGIGAALVAGLFAAGLLGAAPALAQDEPSLFEPTPTPPPANAAPEVPKLPPPPPVAPTGPLSDRLDYDRWLTMSARERQVFVEGWVAALQMAAARVQQIYLATPVNQRDPQMADFVRDSAPRRGATAYLKEMETIYLTDAGRKLSMVDCFLQAFRRLNAARS